METSTAAPVRPRHPWWRSIRYRMGQFFRGLHAAVNGDDEAPALTVLSPAERALFRRMPVDARRHSLAVLKTLQAEAAIPHDLAVAALLHDVGKAAASDAGAYLGLWLRGPIVVIEAFAPQWLSRLADARPSSSLRYALHVQIHHPEIGAIWAEEAGCSELTCWLIAFHQKKLPTGSQAWCDLLTRLQAADNRN